MQRNNLSIRTGSHVGQQLPSNSESLIFKFLLDIIVERKLNDISPENIINIDETALMYNMPETKTVHKIGAKTIAIKTQNQEKSRISVILGICGKGEKLKTLIIFMGAKKEKFLSL